MTNKKTTVTRIIIYLLIAFVPSWIALFWYRSKYGFNTNTILYHVLGIFSMLMPSVGAIFTRIITKEGFKNSLLKLNVKGNVRYYITAVLTPVLSFIIGAFLVSMFLLPKGSTSEILSKLPFTDFFTTLIYAVSLSCLICFHALGEEIGWRGYLIPKLEELTNTPVALIIGGFIWGLWHTPMIASGQNFGTEYKFSPYTGILLMCVYCTFIGAFYVFLTKKTNSVFPAAISHSIHNDTGGGIIAMILMYCNDSVSINEFTSVVVSTIIPGVIVGIVSFILILKHEKDKKLKAINK